jgi:phosphate starvation-inducible membrane PsiE
MYTFFCTALCFAGNKYNLFKIKKTLHLVVFFNNSNNGSYYMNHELYNIKFVYFDLRMYFCASCGYQNKSGYFTKQR